MNRSAIVLMMLLVFCLVTSASSEVPESMTFQGKLTNDSGDPVPNGTYSMTFGVYTTAVGGSPLFTTGPHSVQVTAGLFTQVLPLPMSGLPDTGSCWIGAFVDGEEMLPRTPIVSVPFAHYAKSGGGWTRHDSIVQLANPSDYVGIRNSNPREPLVIGDDLGRFSSEYVTIGNSDPSIGRGYSGYMCGEDQDNRGKLIWDDYKNALFMGTNEGGVAYSPTLILKSGRVGIALPYDSYDPVTTISEPLVVGQDLGAFYGNRIVVGDANPLAETGLVLGRNSDNRGWLLWDNELVKMSLGTREAGTTYGSVLNLQSGNVGVGVEPKAFSKFTVDEEYNTTSTRYGIISHAKNSATSTVFGVWSKGELLNQPTAHKNVYGVYGVAQSNGYYNYGGPFAIGVMGYGIGGNPSYGLWGEASGGTSNFALYANGFSYVNGSMTVVGVLVKGGGAFRIDHPLDPENKYLQHSFVESPDMMNIYNGNAVLDGKGEATVQLPDWFTPLNRDFRYQLTCIGGFAPVFVAEKIANGRFRIAGGTPGLEVSWQVTGIRQDRWAEANRVEVELAKPPDERGLYLHPEAHGLSRDQGIDSRIVSPATEAMPQE